jgi:phage-related protein
LSYWRQDFFFEPDIGIQNSVNLKISKLNLKNSFSQNIKTQKNIAALNLTYKFTNITTQKAKAILHFLENKGGYRRFRVNMDSVYNKPKVFYAPSWTHTWKYEDSHDIEVELIEDPMGVIPKD